MNELPSYTQAFDRWRFLINPVDRNTFIDDLIRLYSKGVESGKEIGRKEAEEERKLEESCRTLPMERGIKAPGSVPVKRRSEET